MCLKTVINKRCGAFTLDKSPFEKKLKILFKKIKYMLGPESEYLPQNEFLLTSNRFSFEEKVC